MNISRILFATDLEGHDHTALEYASSLAASFNAELHVVYVADVVATGTYGGFDSPPAFYFEEVTRQQLEERLGKVTPTASGVPCIHHFRTGNPSEEIVNVAQKEGMDFIVMASHGRRGVTRVLLGSVAENVLRHATCPVLIVKQESEAKLPMAAK
jgi:universal stress protein A